MRPSSLRLLLTGCALLALAAPAAAQEAPVVVDPPLELRTQPLPTPEPSPAVMPEAPPAAEGETPAPEIAPGTPIEAAPPIPAVWAPAPVDGRGRSAYGLYLAGRVASIRGDQAQAAALLAESHALTPEQPALGDEAFRIGLLTGDLDTVARLSSSVEQTPELAEVGRFVTMIQAVRRDDAQSALAIMRARPFSGPYAFVADAMNRPVSAMAGDWAVALAPVEKEAADPLGIIPRYQRAQLLEHRRRYDEADAEFKVLMANPVAARLFTSAYGEFLERRGRREEAVALYRTALTGGSADPEALIGLERAASRGRPPAPPTLAADASEALKFGAMVMGEQGQHPLSAVFLRLADGLDPSDMTALRLGIALAASHYEEPARQVFLRVSPANPILYAGAQYNLGLSFQRAENKEAALAALRRAVAAAPGQTRLTLALAGQLMDLQRYDEALALLNGPGVNTADQAADVRFLRGAALESIDRVEEAEGELWAALQAYPDNPIILNHLGYLWVDSGRRVDQGAEMIARAFAADPRNGNIQDSLGWAQYRQGQFETAVRTLEGAVSKEPSNAEINDHLGDAYWQVGRRREAQWQWNRVLTLEPDAERRAEIERKLVQGLASAPIQTASQP